MASAPLHSLCFSTSLFCSFHLLLSFFFFLFCMLASLHASVLHISPPSSIFCFISSISSSCPSCSSLPALPSADHALITLRRKALPLVPSPFSPDVPHSAPSLSDFLQTKSPYFYLCLPPFFVVSFPPPLPSSSLLYSPSIHKTVHPSIHPFIQPATLSLFLPTSPNPTAVGSKCRADRA